jgi:uncharacterized membrane protein
VDDDRTPVLTRSIWTFVWFAILAVGTNAWGSWSIWSGFSVIGPVIALMGVVGMVLVWVIPDSHYRGFEHVSFGASIATVLLANGPLLATNHDFNTDSAAFNQRAMQLLVKGKDPYTARFKASHLLLKNATHFWTYTLNGTHVDKLSYPAGALVLQTPFLLLGLRHLTTDWVDLFAWFAAAAILYVVSPRNEKWLAPLLVLASMFTFLFANGDTDAMFVPFMMLAALRWDDFITRTGPKWTRWLGPVSLGIACSIKQMPWFTVPFFLVGIAIEANAHGVPVARTLARYVGFVAAPIVAINLPFFIWSPGAWLHGTFLPLTQPLIPDGQGLVSLATHGVARVVHPMDLQLAAALLLVGLLASFVIWYPKMKRAWLFALPLILFVPSRSLSTYLVDFIPAAFVIVLTTTRVPEVNSLEVRPWLRRGVVAVPTMLAIVAATFAFLSPPLGVKLDKYSSVDDNQYFGDMKVTLHNNTDQAITPHVMVVVGSDHPDGFWRPNTRSGSLTVAAHETVTTTFIPPAHCWAPDHEENWLVEVLTSSPSALMTTPAYHWPYPNE